VESLPRKRDQKLVEQAQNFGSKTYIFEKTFKTL
jgi:hypothetical protein